MRAIILKALTMAALVFVTTTTAQTWDCGWAVETGEVTGAVTATLSGGTLTISGTGDMGHFYSVPWSDYKNSITGVVINDGVTSISDNAFSGCTGLTSVTIPNSVTSIGRGAFYGCSRLTSLTIPNSVTSIGREAFSGCTGLTSVTIGNSVTSIGGSAFSDCPNLTEINVGNGNTAYSSINGVLFNNARDTLLLYPKGKRGAYSIPNSVTSVGNAAFGSCTSLTSVTIPASVTSIGGYAFSGCTNLTSVTIPNSVTSIGYYAFSNCTNLTSVTIPNSVTSIGSYAFSGCTNLTSVTIPNSVTSIGWNAFRGCSGLTSVTIPNSVVSIGQEAFSGCTGLTSVTIPNSVIYIVFGTFNGCTGLTSVTIGNSVTSIGRRAFWGCTGLTSVTCLREVPPTLGDDVFYNVNTASVCLYVPNTAIDAYRSASAWMYINFSCIQAANVSVLTHDRVIPQPKPPEEATVIAPMVILAGEFTAGPNPISRQSGIVNFYRQGKRVSNSELRIYDATGNVINKVNISDNTIGTQVRRQVGTWDLCDKTGRIVPEGTYLVKGILKTSDGKSEKISLILSVR